MKMARKQRIKPKVPFAPMGDIAFLLIIFFMITSVFIKEAHVEVQLPSAAALARIEDSFVAVTMNQDADLWVQGRPCELEEVEALVSVELETRKSKIVTLKIDERLRQEQFAPLLAALSRTEAELAWIGEEQP